MEPEQQDFTRSIELRQRLRFDDRKRLRRIALNLRDASDGIAGWEDAIESGRDEEIVLLHVRLDGEERKCELVHISSPYGDRANAVAIHLYGCRVFVVTY